MAYRPIARDEIPTLTELFGRAFRYDAARGFEGWATDTDRTHFSDGRLWLDPERGPAAGLLLFERAVTVGGGGTMAAGLVGMVSVPPEERRRGFASALMRGALGEMRERGLPLSLLFPYSIPFYNRLGYGIASEVWTLELPLRQLRDFDEGLGVRRLGETDLPAMQRLWERERPQHPGWIARTEWEWRRRVLDLHHRAEWPTCVEAVGVAGEGEELRGYLTYTLAPSETIPPTLPKPQALSIQEWVSEDEAAWRALAGFVAAQRSQADFVRYTAPRGFPLVHALAERNTFRTPRNVEFAFRDTLSQGAGLMGRIVHLERALKERRYPAQAQGECVVQMRDALLPANETPLHFYLEGGRAAVAPARNRSRGVAPTATADARTWAELYTGTLPPRDARLLGRLDADDTTLAFLAAAFAGEPWFLPRADWF